MTSGLPVATYAQLFICNKPSTLPTHPAGPYYSNSLTCLVSAQENLPANTLKPCHRLDRVTSGLVVCCTSPKTAKTVQKQMETGNVQKYYLARVDGDFPNNNDDEHCSSSKGIVVDKPIYTADAMNGTRCVDSRGKSSLTEFFKIGDAIDGKSLVLCKPKTG